MTQFVGRKANLSYKVTQNTTNKSKEGMNNKESSNKPMSSIKGKEKVEEFIMMVFEILTLSLKMRKTSF